MRQTLAVACLLTVSPAFATDPVADVPLDAATLSALPRQAVDAKVHDVALHCEGIALVDLLRKANAMPADALRGPALSKLAVVTARDGYRVAFSLAELDPTLGNRRVFVVDRCDGKPLDDKSGPLRLLVPDDARPARGVRQVESIRVQDA